MALIAQPSRNDSEPHPMSLESAIPGQPNRLQIGEGCQEVPRINRDKASQQSGGVGADGGVGNDSGISREISPGEPQAQPGGQAGHTGKPSRAGGEVGVAHSSEDVRESQTRAEPRGGTWTHALPSSEGPGDGSSEGLTPPKVWKQRTLYRKAKAVETGPLLKANR